MDAERKPACWPLVASSWSYAPSISISLPNDGACVQIVFYIIYFNWFDSPRAVAQRDSPCNSAGR